MKLSGHNYNNDVFKSLLDGISKDVEVKFTKTAAIKSADVDDFFSSTTAKDLENIHRDQLDVIASELNFAAERSHVEVNTEDLAKFASIVQKDNIKGKSLERAAQKYCNNLERSIAAPKGTFKVTSEDMLNSIAASKIVPAGYNSETGINDSRTGKFMGSSKNPNTIWDTEALQRFASKQEKDTRKFGDEQITKGNLEEQKRKLAMLKTPTMEKLAEENEVIKMRKKVTSSNSESMPASNPKNPINAMSIFDSNRDFENIPEKTLGENIVALAEERANKKATSEKEYRDIQKPKTTKDNLNKLFS